MRPGSIQKRGFIFILSGPSGSGKTTLAKSLASAKNLRNKLTRSVSFSTRPKRLNEKGSKDYFFISEKQFKEKLRAKKILEWTRYLGYYYATPRDFVDKQLIDGKHLLFCLDLKGTLRVKQLYPQNTVTIFVMPPSLEALQERIRKRCGRTSAEEINKRLALAKSELLAARRYDYCVVNDDLGQVLKELKGIILNKIRN